MGTFRTNAIRGIKWSFINKFGLQLLKFIFSVVLARLLSPNDFGLFAMITVFSNFGLVFKDLGFGHALIYQKDNSRNEYDSVFSMNLFIGILLSIIFFVLASSIASFYDEPRLNYITKAFSLVFILQSVSLVNIVELKKKIDFKKIAFVENVSYFSSSIIAIIFAFTGFGVWSLVIRSLLNSVFRSLALFWITEYRPKFNLQFKIIKRLWKYSLSVSLTSFLTYWIRNLDNLMIGKLIGQETLGIYNMAYQIMLIPVQNISGVIKDVLFPSFSSVNNDITIIRTVYLKTVQSVALISFPILAGVSILSDTFVWVLLGEKWNEMVFPLRLLALIAIPQSVFAVNGTIYLNTGRPDIPLKINLISLPVYAFGFYFGLKINGMIGLIYAYIIIYILMIIPIFYYSSRSIELRLVTFLTKLSPIIIGVVVMYGGISTLKEFFILDFKKIATLFVLILLGALLYTSVIILFRQKIYLYDLIRSKK